MRDDYNNCYPISAWGYVGYTILFSIPVVGFICLLVLSFSNKNVVRRSYARSYFCWLLIAIVLLVVGYIYQTANGNLTSSQIQQKYHEIVDPLTSKNNTSSKRTSSPTNTVKPTSVVTETPVETESDKVAVINVQATSVPKLTATPTKQKTTAKSYKLVEGQYVIGEDIEPGKYKLTCLTVDGETEGDLYSSLGGALGGLIGGEEGQAYANAMGSLGGLYKTLSTATVDIVGEYGSVIKSYDLKPDQSVTLTLKTKTAINVSDGTCKLEPTN